MSVWQMDQKKKKGKEKKQIKMKKHSAGVNPWAGMCVSQEECVLKWKR